jgi:4-amino-4-deoxy-L-arabinose transferase-like glycosyltransferase
MTAGPYVRRDLLVLALLAALLFLPGLGRRDLWNPDEARYAEVAREMRESGSWFIPRLNGETYTQKPPLLFWLIDLSAALTGGRDESDSRIPSALAAIGAILLVYRLGDRLFSRRAGWLAAAAFGTCFKILWQGRFGQIDMLLTALVTLGVWFWARGYTEKRPGLYPLFFLCAGFATLAKGPVGLLPPLLSIVAFLCLTRDWEELRRLRIGRGLLVWAAVVLAWLVPAGLTGGREYLQQIVFKQNVTRYADPWHHFQPWYYYLTVIPGEFFPWSLFLPAAGVVGWRYGDLKRGGPRPGALFAACWVAVTLIFFSVSPAKRSVYVLTLYPALALLVGSALDRVMADWPRHRRWLTVPLGILAGFALVVTAALAIAGPGRKEALPLGGPTFAYLVALAFVPLLLGAIYAFWQGRHGRIAHAAGGIAAGMGALGLAVGLFILPRFDVVKSARELSGVLLTHLEPGESYGIYPRIDSTFVYYTRRYCVSLESEQALREYASRPGRVWILAQRDDLKKIQPPLPLEVVAEDGDLEAGYLLLTKR